MLSWPQNAGNPISEDFQFKTFLGKHAPGPPYRGPPLAYCISNPLFQNSVTAPALNSNFNTNNPYTTDSVTSHENQLEMACMYSPHKK